MATLIKRNGRFSVRFTNDREERKIIALQTKSERQATALLLKIEALLAQKGAPDAETAAWLAGLKESFRRKLIDVGLLARPEPAATLGTYLKGYFSKRNDVKGATRVNWRHTERCLLTYFGADRTLDTITAGDAKDWERWLLSAEAREHRYGETKATEGLARNTVRKRICNAKQFFQDAVSRDLIRKNPFAGISGSVGSNRERDYFVTRAEADKVVEACPDAQWRLLFVLSRYGGLRCPSEHLALTWADVDFPGGRLTVHSPKTEHHPDGAVRVIPIFPELRPYLEDVHALLPEGRQGSEHVITRYRHANANLRSQLQRIIKRAGLTPWPKLFQNLRATRETELANTFPMHVVCKWIGNSPKVAAKHYLQVTDEDYARAIEVEQRAIFAPETPRTTAQVEEVDSYDAQEHAGKRMIEYQREESMGVTGFEPVTSSV